MPGGPNDPYLFGFIDSLISIHFPKGATGAVAKPILPKQGFFLWTPLQTITTWIWNPVMDQFQFLSSRQVGDVSFKVALAAAHVNGPFSQSEARNAASIYDGLILKFNSKTLVMEGPFNYSFQDPGPVVPGISPIGFSSESSGDPSAYPQFFHPHAAGVTYEELTTVSVGGPVTVGVTPWPGPATINSSGASPF